jgi:hypothetical protein
MKAGIRFGGIVFLICALVLPSAAQQYVLIGWNDLGMHCSNKNFSKVVVLPPFNNITAQLILKQDGQLPQIVTTGYTVEYSIPNNTFSVGKTDFWTYAQQLFGLASPLPANIGLAGKGLTGVLDSTGPTFFSARGIPVTPYADSDLVHETPYQLIHLVAKSTSTGATLATTDVVIPVSNEVGCVQSGCHSSETAILNSHESVSGFNRNGPVLCASCHASNALGTTGIAEARPFSYRMHSVHNHVAGSSNSINTCYKCHPGPNTQCLRDVMGKNPTNPLICENCHGSMDTVAQTILRGRRPWLDEPKCGSCHGANFAEETGKLFRQSVGHGGLYCSACHGSPHAILPTVQPNDNLQSIRLQGYAGALRKCSVCHATTPSGPGPHGLMDTTIVNPSLPAAPALAQPLNGAAGVSQAPQVTWNSASGAAKYELQMATDQNFAAVVYDDSTLTSVSAQPTFGTGPQTIYWHVRGNNAAGWGGWSAVWSFTTAAPVYPATPLLASPADAAVGVSTMPLLQWNTAANATKYRVQVASDSLFGSLVADDSALTAPSKLLFLGSGPQTYYWHVKGLNSTGGSAWSATWSFTTASGTTVSMSVDRAWNMVALPVIVTSADVSSVFPTAVTRAFIYSGSYIRQDTLVPGRGYWIKFAGPATIGLTGAPFHADTAVVVAGWNLIGSISDPITAASVQSIPPGLISSGFFAYRGNYVLQDTLVPGRAYWVRAANAGLLVFQAVTGGTPALKSLARNAEQFDRVTVRDASGAAQTLYLASGSPAGADMNLFDLPPAPPAGSFDVRFASNSSLAAVRPGANVRLPVLVSSTETPLTVEWSINSIPGTVSLDLGGMPVPVAGSGSMMLSSGSTLTGITVTPPEIAPREFALEQNYPNPFNPSTKFRYNLPVRAQLTLSIFNLAGQEVAKLVDGVQDAGVHEIFWNADAAHPMASGVYFYRIDAAGVDDPSNSFRQIRKLVLLK